MTSIDYVIAGIIVLSAFVSLIRGFTREGLSLITWFAAFFIAKNYYIDLLPYLQPYLTSVKEENIRNGISIVILFVATLIVGGLVNYVLSKFVAYTGLSSFDRILGFFFGVLRGILIVTLILFMLDTLTSITETPEWKKSVLIPHFHYISAWFFGYLQENSGLLETMY